MPQTVVAFLACASLGAVWSVCSADMGPLAVLDRFRQIEPMLLIACDGYSTAARCTSARAGAPGLLDELPSVRDVVLWRNLDPAPLAVARGCRPAAPTISLRCAPTRAVVPRWLAFDHPLWIVYSSGTTGLPKAIVHGHGGVMLEQLKGGALHNDVGASVETGDRYHWYSSTGWIMWNSQMAALLGGTTVCMFDGSPRGRRSGVAGRARRRLVDALAIRRGTRVTFFGAGAAFYASCLKAGVEPQAAPTSALRAVGATGSPLAHRTPTSGSGQGAVGRRRARSGSTRSPAAPTSRAPSSPACARCRSIAGEMQCRCLGAAVEAWSDRM